MSGLPSARMVSKRWSSAKKNRTLGRTAGIATTLRGSRRRRPGRAQPGDAGVAQHRAAAGGEEAHRPLRRHQHHPTRQHDRRGARQLPGVPRPARGGSRAPRGTGEQLDGGAVGEYARNVTPASPGANQPGNGAVVQRIPLRRSYHTATPRTAIPAASAAPSSMVASTSSSSPVSSASTAVPAANGWSAAPNSSRAASPARVPARWPAPAPRRRGADAACAGRS